MSGTTVSSYSTIGIKLTNPDQNPVTITETGEIYSSLSNAIDGSHYATWTIDNLGTLGSSYQGGSAAGILLGGSGFITNGSATDQSAKIFDISGFDSGFGVVIQGQGSVDNYGTILGQRYGISGGYINVTNGAETDHAALISGGTNADGNLTNLGTIKSSGGTAVVDFGTHVNIVNGSAIDRSALLTGKINGVLVGEFNTLTNFGTIAGGTLNGGSAYGVEAQGGILSNTGLIEGYTGVYITPSRDASGTLTNAGTIIGGGGSHIAVEFGTTPGTPPLASRLIIDPGAVFIGAVEGLQKGLALEFASATNAGTVTGIGSQFTGFNTLAFDGGASWLVSGSSIGLASGETITGFARGDTIELTGFTATSHSFVSGKGLELSDGTLTETLNLQGSFGTEAFTVTTNADGTEIIICYLRGTRIMTDRGERAIETLAIGDAVVTRAAGVRKIKWIGRQSFGRRFLPAEMLPVRIAAGALGEGMPGRDLFVSPGHSMLLDGRLVLAKLLVNGVTITQDAAPEDIHYYQLEFERHDCVLAEGAWSESYADAAGMRGKFHNAGEFDALYPDYEAPAEPVLCAARPQSGPALAAALRPVVARAGAAMTPGPLRGWIDAPEDDGTIRGWALDERHPRLPVLLQVMLDEAVIGEVLACEFRGDLAAAGMGDGRCSFRFSPARLGDDRRRLSVRRLVDGATLACSHEYAAMLGDQPMRRCA